MQSSGTRRRMCEQFQAASSNANGLQACLRGPPRRLGPRGGCPVSSPPLENAARTHAAEGTVPGPPARSSSGSHPHHSGPGAAAARCHAADPGTVAVGHRASGPVMKPTASPGTTPRGTQPTAPRMPEHARVRSPATSPPKAASAADGADNQPPGRPTHSTDRRRIGPPDQHQRRVPGKSLQTAAGNPARFRAGDRPDPDQPGRNAGPIRARSSSQRQRVAVGLGQR